MDKNKSAEEIQKAAIWLSKQSYQKEQGEQEYMMYFDVDIPKMLVAYSQQANAELQKEVDKWRDSANYYKDTYPVIVAELEKQNAELVLEIERLKKLVTKSKRVFGR